jgi:hypothetical protein
MATYIAWVFETKPTEGSVAYGVEAADYQDAVEKARASFGPFAQVEREPQQQRETRAA